MEESTGSQNGCCILIIVSMSVLVEEEPSMSGASLSAQFPFSFAARSANLFLKCSVFLGTGCYDGLQGNAVSAALNISHEGYIIDASFGIDVNAHFLLKP